VELTFFRVTGFGESSVSNGIGTTSGCSGYSVEPMRNSVCFSLADWASMVNIGNSPVVLKVADKASPDGVFTYALLFRRASDKRRKRGRCYWYELSSWCFYDS
jgi:hypothetical protein